MPKRHHPLADRSQLPQPAELLVLRSRRTAASDHGPLGSEATDFGRLAGGFSVARVSSISVVALIPEPI
jgi:hypothetical protein